MRHAKRVVKQRGRRGVATIWVLAAMPALLALVLVLLELGHLWSARVEVENSLESAALAAVREWGVNGGSQATNWTSTARTRGQTLAAANTVNGNAVAIGTNLGIFNSGSNPNENSAYLPAPGQIGNLVFGAATESPTGTWTFDGTNAPECGGALILVDATGSGNLFSGTRNEWGVSFQTATDLTLRITRIEINLATMSQASVFNGTAELDTAADTISSAKVKYSSSSLFQQDISGFTLLANDMLSGQIVASYPSTQVLRLDFSAALGDDGFRPGDRFRFAQAVTATSGGSQRDGDDVGGNGSTGGATVTIYFNNATSISAQLRDNTDTGEVGAPIPKISPITGSYIVSTAQYPPGIADLPASATSSSNNNGQSYVLFSGAGSSGTEYFAVRAQGVIPVPSLFGSYFGGLYSTHNVTVDTTAIYDCANGRSRLVRIDNYVHP